MWPVNSIVFGIRHRRVFGFLGRAGDILDEVRSSEGGPVIPSDLFQKIQWPNQITARMLNDRETVTVDFSIEGVILNVDLDAVGWSRQRARDLFVELCRIALPISRGRDAINRIGIIDNYTIDHTTPGEQAVTALTTLQAIGRPTDFTLRAAFRNATPQGWHQEGVEDWLNTILQVGAQKKSDESDQLDSLKVSIDHQVYYVPERRYSSGLIAEHFDRFMRHVDELQRGPLAGLLPAAAEHGR